MQQIKLIIILRDPVYRAYSQYNNGVRDGLEKLSFEDMLQVEIKNLEGDISIPYEKFFKPRSVLVKGIYVEQLKIWNSIFKKEQIHILSTEELSTNTEITMDLVYDFLELPKHKIIKNNKMKSVKYPEMSQKTKEFLIEFYKPYNKKLFKLIDKEFNWSS